MDFNGAVSRAATEAIADIRRVPSPLSGPLLAWLGKLADLDNPGAYFSHPESLPLLALPWWLEQSIRGTVDPEFQLDLMASSINGYYFTRMLDDIMDDHPIDRSILPALYSFHLRFTRPYSKHFEPESPFWRHFDRILMVTVEAASSEAALQSVTAEDFDKISARKPAAAVIPLAAVCARYGRFDLLPAWEEMFASFGKWHQMRDDLFDWSGDHQAGHPSWLLSEAARRREGNESVPAWIAREGFGWIRSVMAGWMAETIHTAEALHSPDLVHYLSERHHQFSREIDARIAQAAAYRQLLTLDTLNSTRALSKETPIKSIL